MPLCFLLIPINSKLSPSSSVFKRIHTWPWVVLKMAKADKAAFFNTAIVANSATSFTTDKIREEPSDEVSLQLIPGHSMTVAELLPLNFGAIVVEPEELTQKVVWLREFKTMSEFQLFINLLITMLCIHYNRGSPGNVQ